MSLKTNKTILPRQSASGRSYVLGRKISEDLHDLILNDLSQARGAANENDDPRLPIKGKYGLPRGTFTTVAAKYSVCRMTVKRLWVEFMNTGRPAVKKDTVLRDHKGKKLTGDNLEYVRCLKVEQPSMLLREIKDKLLQHSNIEQIHVSTVSRALKELQMTFKKIQLSHKDRYTDYNLNYTQQFINYVSTKNPFTLKFMDEMGVTKLDAHPTRGHSYVGTRAIELSKHNRHENHTLSLIVGVDGVKYTKVLPGAANTATFLDFMFHASTAHTLNGQPALRPGDTLILDNCAIHHHEAERILRPYLGQLGIDYLFLPAYSPDLNPAENCFGKIKSLLKRPEFAQIVGQNLTVAVYTASTHISAHDTHSWFRMTNYINV